MIRKLFSSFLAISAVYLFTSLLLLFILTKYLLPDGFIIAGHDSGLAIDSKAFLETRFYAWDERINFGEDNSLLFGSLTLHTIDYLSSLIAQVPYAGNQVNLFFWLGLVFTAAFVFGYQLRQSLGNSFVFILPFFITFNFYIFQSVFILERAKYSLVAATLFFLAIIARLVEKKISVIPGAILTSLLFSVFNGGSWLGLPLFGGLVIILTVILCFILGNDIREKTFKNSGRFFSFLIVTAVLFGLINSYSLFPYLQTFFKQDYLLLQDTVTHDSNKAWLDYISQGSSFLNIFRMQGIPDWYETKFTASPTHPFAKFYTENPYMIILSFLIPLIAFGSLLFAKSTSQKKIVGIASVVTLVSMIFMAASRSPWGFVYEFLYNNVPGFLIFRSSFYKFGYAFFIAYSLLIAFSLSSLINLLKSKFTFLNRKIILNSVFVILIIAGWMLYHQKLLSQDIFKWRQDFSTEVKIPSYVNDYNNYVTDRNITQGRVLILPKFHKVWLSDGYDWGYWSLSTIHYSLTKESVISNSSGLTPEERSWVDLLYQSISNNDAKNAEAIAKRLGITRFLVKMDAITGQGWSGAENPEDIKKKVEAFGFIEEEKQFGKWILYRIKSPEPELFLTDNQLVQIPEKDVTKIYPFLETDKGIFDNGLNNEPLKNFLTSRIDQLKCDSCLIEGALTPHEFIWSRILPNSLLFPLKIKYENYKLEKISDPKIKLEYYYNLILKRSGEISSMFFYRTHDAYVINDLKAIREDFDLITLINQQTSNPESFVDAKNLENNIVNIKNLLVTKLSSDESFSLSGILKEEISRTIWKIDQLEKYYSPVLDNPDQWVKNKVFEIEVKELPYQLYIDENSLPKASDGSRIYPDVVLNDKIVNSAFRYAERKANWIPINSSSLRIGENKLILKFETDNNLLTQLETTEIDTPIGKRECYKSDLNPRPPVDTFLLKVKTNGSVLKFFPKLQSGDEISGFLDWNKVITINDYYKQEYFRYYYPVPSTEENFSFYICGEHEELPNFKEFSMEEVFAPEVIGVQQLANNSDPKLAVTYNRIDPTKFSLHINPSDKPYILVMNQRYSALWQLKNAQTGLKLSEPFPVDLYSTGWVINSKDAQDLVVEYAPQQYFYKGVLVSGITLLSIALVVLVTVIKKKRK